ncbi:hypothetical protein PV797_02835 [Clostridiaceae bacterium M8S5]|nr:hypothetical protein PV797_02835 [Clostridiaceae bacterium M8S5]
MGIDVLITAGEDAASSKVSASGSVQHVITDDERASFLIGDKQLKDAVGAYFGRSPDDAYVKSPTPWGDLYKTYGWPQVQTVLYVESAEILGLTSQPVIVKTQEFSNQSSQKGTFNVAISETLNNTSSSNWSTGGTLTFGRSISVGIDFIVKAKVEYNMSYSQSWGIGGSHSKSITVGSTSGVTVELDPGETIIASLSASRGTLKVRLRYNAYLIGSTAVNYGSTYKDHHFWSLPIGAVMSAGGITNSIKSTEDIEIGYYSNSKIELKDKDTGQQKGSFLV